LGGGVGFLVVATADSLVVFTVEVVLFTPLEVVLFTPLEVVLFVPVAGALVAGCDLESEVETNRPDASRGRVDVGVSL